MVGREEIAKCVRDLIVGEEGKLLRKKTTELKDAAAMATSEHGSSTKSLAQLIQIFENHNHCRRSNATLFVQVLHMFTDFPSKKLATTKKFVLCDGKTLSQIPQTPSLKVFATVKCFFATASGGRNKGGCKRALATASVVAIVFATGIFFFCDDKFLSPIIQENLGFFATVQYCRR
ncbi:hypothetical protein ACSBR2_038189 [Camellia fascicularis]